MIDVRGLWKSYGSRDLFRDAELQVRARDRVAIVGPNGSGKTTLFEMLTGRDAPDRGDITIPKDVVLGHLEQETDPLRGKPLLEEVLSAGSETTDIGHRLSVLEAEMSDMEAGEDLDRLVSEYGRLQDRFATLGGYSIEAEAKTILGGLGFGNDDFERLTETFSGGWLMRIALAKLLVAAPDVLMLDEPTNHLDVESVVWLERFLSTYEGAVMLISHDRDFINGIATKVVEIHEAALVTYTGNYEDFVRQREMVALQAEAAAKNQERKIAQTEVFINRFRYKASKARQVQSRIKSLEKLERERGPRRRERQMGISFPTPPRAGRVVLELNDLRFGYGDVPVYDGLNLAIERDQKIALVGPNGAGKTTLLKLLAGVLEPQGGERRLGHNTHLGYFAQHQIEALDPSNRVVQELQRAIPRDSDIKPRNLLGRFMFSGDDVDKPVSVLSGGERTRLALAKLLVSPTNLLLLDEPTNHLDIQSRDVLEDALSEYAGAMVLITHDRHLIRNCVDRIVEVVDGRVTEFVGGYDYYLDKKEPEPEPEFAPRGAGPKGKERRRVEAEERAKTKHLRDRVTKLERELEVLGTELAGIEKLMADPDLYSSDMDIAGLVREYETLKDRSRKLEESWESAASELEEAQAARAG